MKKLFIILFALASLMISMPAKATDLIVEETTITLPEYQEWDRVTLNGKVRMKGMPVSPSVRIFMENDKLIEISIRVMLMGEVGRIILTPDSVLAINKMKKTYSKMRIGDFTKFYPGGFLDLQSLLLGRVVIPGYGEIDGFAGEILEAYSTSDGNFAIVPSPFAAIQGISYGYIVNPAFQPTVLYISPDSRDDLSFVVNYDYKKGGYDLTFGYQEGNKAMSATLELSNPEWKGEPLKAIDLDKKYREVDLKELMKF